MRETVNSLKQPQPRGAYSLDTTDRARLIAGTEALMAFGPRMIAELLLQTAGAGETEALLRRLDDFARAAPAVVALGGADWTAPIRAALRRGRAA